jgi:hypothetical protein
MVIGLAPLQMRPDLLAFGEHFVNQICLSKYHFSFYY